LHLLTWRWMSRLDSVEAGEFRAFLDAIGRRLHARRLALDFAFRKNPSRSTG
jgi:hypothetical protein